MRFQDVPQLTSCGHYHVNVSWTFLEKTINDAVHDYKMDLDPDFQREHVWNEGQQVRYVEWILRGGRTGRDLYFNCAGWNRGPLVGPYVLVDGKQRINAVLRFLHNEIPVFGNNYFKDFTDTMRLIGPDFIWHVNDLANREQILQWYLDLNSGGTVHTNEEIEKVKKLLDVEKTLKKPKGKKAK